MAVAVHIRKDKLRFGEFTRADGIIVHKLGVSHIDRAVGVHVARERLLCALPREDRVTAVDVFAVLGEAAAERGGQGLELIRGLGGAEAGDAVLRARAGNGAFQIVAVDIVRFRFYRGQAADIGGVAARTDDGGGAVLLKYEPQIPPR